MSSAKPKKGKKMYCEIGDRVTVCKHAFKAAGGACGPHYLKGLNGTVTQVGFRCKSIPLNSRCSNDFIQVQLDKIPAGKGVNRLHPTLLWFRRGELTLLVHAGQPAKVPFCERSKR